MCQRRLYSGTESSLSPPTWPAYRADVSDNALKTLARFQVSLLTYECLTRPLPDVSTAPLSICSSPDTSFQPHRHLLSFRTCQDTPGCSAEHDAGAPSEQQPRSRSCQPMSFELCSEGRDRMRTSEPLQDNYEALICRQDMHKPYMGGRGLRD